MQVMLVLPAGQVCRQTARLQQLTVGHLQAGCGTSVWCLCMQEVRRKAEHLHQLLESEQMQRTQPRPSAAQAAPDTPSGSDVPVWTSMHRQCLSAEERAEAGTLLSGVCNLLQQGPTTSWGSGSTLQACTQTSSHGDAAPLDAAGKLQHSLHLSHKLAFPAYGGVTKLPMQLLTSSVTEGGLPDT